MTFIDTISEDEATGAVAEMYAVMDFADKVAADSASVMLDALGVEADAGYRKLGAELNATLTVGRPVAN